MKAHHFAVVGATTLVVLAGCGGEEPPTEPAPAATTTFDSGLPPKPDRATVAAYIAELNKIDPDIVGDKDPDRLVSRGRDQCSSVTEWPDDQAKLIDLTNQRFTSPDHPDGFGRQKAARILAVVRKHIC